MAIFGSFFAVVSLPVDGMANMCVRVMDFFCFVTKLLACAIAFYLFVWWKTTKRFKNQFLANTEKWKTFSFALRKSITTATSVPNCCSNPMEKGVFPIFYWRHANSQCPLSLPRKLSFLFIWRIEIRRRLWRPRKISLQKWIGKKRRIEFHSASSSN